MALSGQQKNNELDRLFQEWQETLNEEDRRKFVRDGIIETEKWDKADRKVLFLLKEVNLGAKSQAGKMDDDDPGKWDIRIGGSKYPWNVLGQWAYGLQHRRLRPSFEEARAGQDDAFRASAVMNLKKPAGTEQANMATIALAAWRDQAFLARQLEVIRPDVVVCCGSGSPTQFDIARRVFRTLDGCRQTSLPKEAVAERLSGQAFRDLEGCLWLDYVHPSTRGRGCTHEVLYEFLMRLDGDRS